MIEGCHWFVLEANQLFCVTKYRAENETVGIPDGFPEWRALELTARSKSMRSACMSWVSGTPSSLGVPSSLRARTTWPHTYLWATNREQTFQPSAIEAPNHQFTLEFLNLEKGWDLAIAISHQYSDPHFMEGNPNCIHSGPLNCEHVLGDLWAHSFNPHQRQAKTNWGAGKKQTQKSQLFAIELQMPIK